MNRCSSVRKPPSSPAPASSKAAAATQKASCVHQASLLYPAYSHSLVPATCRPPANAAALPGCLTCPRIPDTVLACASTLGGLIYRCMGVWTNTLIPQLQIAAVACICSDSRQGRPWNLATAPFPRIRDVGKKNCICIPQRFDNLPSLGFGYERLSCLRQSRPAQHLTALSHA